LALADFLQLIRPTTSEERRQQRLFRAHARDAAARLRGLFEAWEALREIEPDYSRLANAAAVNRWELMRLAHDTQQLQTPRAMAGAHRELHTALGDAARACQLLANGYRFHKSEAVCDGQALLVDTLAALDRLVAQLGAT
jgi:hypothetical protein